MLFSPRRSALSVALAAGLAAPALGQAIPATAVLKVGDPIGSDGALVTGVGQPYVNSLGKAGFVVLLSPPASGRAIWYDGAVVFENFNAPDVPTGSEDTMGISDAGGWIYSPAVNGNDAVYTNNGSLLKDGDPLPNNPGFFSVFNSRPRMADTGAAFWIGGYGPATSTTHRAMFRSTNTADPNSPTIVFGTGDVVGGFTIASGGPGFTYDISPSGLHYINPVTLTATTATDAAIILDATSIIAQEGTPTGFGDNWQAFGAVGINDSGNWILAGDTNNPATATDGFLVYNGQPAVREGDILAGVTLSGNPVAAAIDNSNRVLFSWNPTATETVFLAQAPDIAGTAQVLLRVGDVIDTTGDGVADYTIQDFNASTTIANVFDLSVAGPIFLNVDLREIGGATDIEAIIAIGGGGEPECPTDWDESGSVNSSDISAFLTAWLSSLTNGDLIADFDNSGAVNSSDISAFLTQWLTDVTGGNC